MRERKEKKKKKKRCFIHIRITGQFERHRELSKCTQIEDNNKAILFNRKFAAEDVVGLRIQ